MYNAVMQIRFWGTRGSIASPSRDTVEFGGNTSCVEVILSDGQSIILDAGTGIRPLGLDYLQRQGASRTLHLFLSHAHWDHIQGFPFFVPALLADFTIHIYCHLDAQEVLSYQMVPPYFPLNLSEARSNMIFHRLGRDPIEIGSGKVSFLTLNHPQEVYGFRIDDQDGGSMIFSTDTEHNEPSYNEALIDFAKDVGALLYDAQYTPEEYDGRVGWGHSTYEAAVDIAKQSGARRLVLFHHEPTHNDATVRAIEKKAQALFPHTLAAREGHSITLP